MTNLVPEDIVGSLPLMYQSNYLQNEIDAQTYFHIPSKLTEEMPSSYHYLYYREILLLKFHLKVIQAILQITSSPSADFSDSYQSTAI